MSKSRNYYQQYLDDVHALPRKEKLLVHVCCGPCSMYPLEMLSRYFDITIYYANSNIYPSSEFDIRLNELIRYLKSISVRYKLVIPEYNPKKHLASLFKYKEAKEGSIRCLKCYALRMDDTAKYAAEQGFKYFTTIMSISAFKSAYYINELGEYFQTRYGVQFIHSDFKKDGGFQENKKRNKKYNLYQQEYCGCIFSLVDKVMED